MTVTSSSVINTSSSDEQENNQHCDQQQTKKHKKATKEHGDADADADADADDEEMWICDICHEKQFSTYEEACQHEEECRRRRSSRCMTTITTTEPSSTASSPLLFTTTTTENEIKENNNHSIVEDERTKTKRKQIVLGVDDDDSNINNNNNNNSGNKVSNKEKMRKEGKLSTTRGEEEGEKCTTTLMNKTNGVTTTTSSPTNNSGCRSCQHSSSSSSTRLWKCDICHEKEFETYEEACQHEEECQQARDARPKNNSNNNDDDAKQEEDEQEEFSEEQDIIIVEEEENRIAISSINKLTTAGDKTPRLAAASGGNQEDSIITKKKTKGDGRLHPFFLKQSTSNANTATTTTKGKNKKNDGRKTKKTLTTTSTITTTARTKKSKNDGNNATSTTNRRQKNKQKNLNGNGREDSSTENSTVKNNNDDVEVVDLVQQQSSVVSRSDNDVVENTEEGNNNNNIKEDKSKKTVSIMLDSSTADVASFLGASLATSMSKEEQEKFIAEQAAIELRLKREHDLKHRNSERNHRQHSSSDKQQQQKQQDLGPTSKRMQYLDETTTTVTNKSKKRQRDNNNDTVTTALVKKEKMQQRPAPWLLFPVPSHCIPATKTSTSTSSSSSSSTTTTMSGVAPDDDTHSTTTTRWLTKSQIESLRSNRIESNRMISSSACLVSSCSRSLSPPPLLPSPLNNKDDAGVGDGAGATNNNNNKQTTMLSMCKKANNYVEGILQKILVFPQQSSHRRSCSSERADGTVSDNDISSSYYYWADKYSVRDIDTDLYGNGPRMAASELRMFIEEWMLQRHKSVHSMTMKQQKLNGRTSNKTTKATKKKKKRKKYDDDIWIDSDNEDDQQKQSLDSVCLLYGPVGSCKTNLVHAVAHSCDCDVLEINTSDYRGSTALRNAIEETTQSFSTKSSFIKFNNNKQQQEQEKKTTITMDSFFGSTTKTKTTKTETKARTATATSDHQNVHDDEDLMDTDDDDMKKEQESLSKKKKKKASVTIILIDEVDIMYDNNGDNGFWIALTDLAYRSKCPIILTANTIPKKEMSRISCREIYVPLPSPRDCVKRMKYILQNEGYTFKQQHRPRQQQLQQEEEDEVLLERIARIYNMDSRRIMNELQSTLLLLLERKQQQQQLEQVGEMRDETNQNDDDSKNENEEDSTHKSEIVLGPPPSPPTILSVRPNKLLACTEYATLTITGYGFSQLTTGRNEQKEGQHGYPEVEVLLGNQRCPRSCIVNDTTIIAIFVGPYKVPENVDPDTGHYKGTNRRCHSAYYAPIIVRECSSSNKNTRRRKKGPLHATDGCHLSTTKLVDGSKVVCTRKSVFIEIHYLSHDIWTITKATAAKTKTNKKNKSQQQDDDIPVTKSSSSSSFGYLTTTKNNDIDQKKHKHVERLLHEEIEIWKRRSTDRNDYDDDCDCDDNVCRTTTGIHNDDDCISPLLPLSSSNKETNSDDTKRCRNLTDDNDGGLVQKMQMECSHRELLSDAAFLEDNAVGGSIPYLSGACRGFGFDLTDEYLKSTNGSSRIPNEERMFELGWKDNTYFYGNADHYVTFPSKATARERNLLRQTETISRGLMSSCCNVESATTIPAKEDENDDDYYGFSWREQQDTTNQDDGFIPQTSPPWLQSLPVLLQQQQHAVEVDGGGRDLCSDTKMESWELFVRKRDDHMEKVLNFLNDYIFPSSPPKGPALFYRGLLRREIDPVLLSSNAQQHIQQQNSIFLDYIPFLSSMAINERARSVVQQMKRDAKQHTGRRKTRSSRRSQNDHYMHNITPTFRWLEHQDGGFSVEDVCKLLLERYLITTSFMSSSSSSIPQQHDHVNNNNNNNNNTRTRTTTTKTTTKNSDAAATATALAANASISAAICVTDDDVLME